MVEKDTHSERAQKPLLANMVPAEFAAMGKKRVEEFATAQTELFDRLREMNRQWFERMRSEANLASEFASKLTAAHSLPDAMTACQEWSGRRFDMMAEDGKHLLADAEKFMQTTARLVSNGGWLPKRGGGGT